MKGFFGKILVSLALVLALILSSVMGASAAWEDFFGSSTTTEVTYQGVVFEHGGIASDYGVNSGTSEARVRTQGFLKVSNYDKIEIGRGYIIGVIMYSKRDNNSRLGSTGWLGDGQDYSIEEILQETPNAVYFRFQIKDSYGGNTTVPINNLSKTGLDLISNGMIDTNPDDSGSNDDTNDDLGVSGGDNSTEFSYENVMKIGFWQEGAIFDGKLFALDHAGSGKVYDIYNKTQIASYSLDNLGAINPHGNSVCFSSQYYAAGDKYPLLYVNVYNNYKNENDRKEGYCCVYRLTENGKNFTTKLVQVIRIGFTENLNFWKSLSNNGDVRPYGNFVVDSDNNDLYAYVMRDATGKTRFFKFDLPTLSDGTYNSSYGCNLVTLGQSDIKDQFDLAYFNYIQGCDYLNGKIISVEGFNNGESGAEPAVRIIDLKTKTLTKTVYPRSAGLINEPEVLAVDPDTWKVYYGASDGTLRILTFIKDEKPGVQLSTLVQEADGKWYYYVDGAKSNETLIFEHNSQLVYVNRGVWDTAFTGFVEYNSKSYYIENGLWNENATTLYKHNNKWIYVENGFLNTSAKTLVKYSGKWFYVENGEWNKPFTGFIKYSGKWFYVKKGKWQSTTDIVKYNGKSFYLKGGKWNSKTETLFKKDGKWHAIKSGKWYKGETIISYSGKKFYVKDGYAKLSFSGKVKINGKTYKIKKGKVV